MSSVLCRQCQSLDTMSSRDRKRQRKAFKIGERVNAKISLWPAQRSVVRMAP